MDIKNSTTPYDMSSGMASGPYGTPNRYAPNYNKDGGEA